MTLHVLEVIKDVLVNLIGHGTLVVHDPAGVLADIRISARSGAEDWDSALTVWQSEIFCVVSACRATCNVATCLVNTRSDLGRAELAGVIVDCMEFYDNSVAVQAMPLRLFLYLSFMFG